uniref:Putative secreted protein n=1 Tax=Ixodes scapularis TaxID=6945 RepID=A0A4D5RE73_IXOSC
MASTVILQDLFSFILCSRALRVVAAKKRYCLSCYWCSDAGDFFLASKDCIVRSPCYLYFLAKDYTQPIWSLPQTCLY